jgi:hypothetical protein
MWGILWNMIIMGKHKISIMWENYGGDPINKHNDIIESQTLERTIIQHFGCINGTLQTFRAKKIQSFIIVVDKPMVRKSFNMFESTTVEKLKFS